MPFEASDLELDFTIESGVEIMELVAGETNEGRRCDVWERN